MTKQAHIIREIEQLIAVGHFQPGQMLPTQKELMERFGVAMGTIQHALGRLQTRGVVMSTRGRGTMVGDAATLHSAGIIRPRIELLQLNSVPITDILVNDTTTVIQQMLGTHGFDTYMRTQLPESTSDLNAWARQTPAAVVIGYQLPARAIQAMRTAHRPLIIAGELFHETCPTGVSQVTVSMGNIIQLAMAALTNMGHRHIALLRGPVDTTYYQGLSQAFWDTADQHDLQNLVQEWRVPSDTEGQDVVESLLALPRVQRPSVLLIDGGQRASRIIFALQRAGLNVPGEISVFAISGHVPTQLAIPSLSRVKTTAARIGQRLAEVLLEILQQRLVVRETLSPVLVNGDTCKPINPWPLTDLEQIQPVEPGDILNPDLVDQSQMIQTGS